MHFRRFEFLALSALLLSLAACDGGPAGQEDSRGPLGKADTFGTCEAQCGGQSEGGCWCDDACVDFGDCCEDKVQVCDCPEIVPPAPGFCPHGETVPVLGEHGICTLGFDCVICPEIVPPAPGFCPDGETVPVLGEHGICTLGFDCVEEE